LSDIRKARKQLLYQALNQRSDVNLITYVSRHRYWWREGFTLYNEESFDKIRVWELSLLFPGERFRWVRVLNRKFVGKRLDNRWKVAGNKVVVFYHPWDTATAQIFKGKALIIFDWTEDWVSFYGDREVEKWQRRALEISDGIITVTRELYALAQDYNSNLLLLPNASSLPIQEVPNIEDSRIAHLPRPRIGYVGHLGPWFDGELVSELIKLMQDCTFIFMGDVIEKWKKILVGKNIQFLGAVSLQELDDLLASMDVLIAPYRNITGDPTKIYDYLTTGKPIVSSLIPGSERFKHVVTFVPRDANVWQSAILQAIKNKKKSLRLDRLKEAKLHTWPERASRLVEWLATLEKNK
jgi:hypothetical protein